jgi:hypothetical protein
MMRRRVGVCGATAVVSLTCACGGAARKMDREQASLRARVDELERKIDSLSARDREPPRVATRPVTGVVTDTDGRPAEGAVVVIVVGDRKDETHANNLGRFEIHPPSADEAFLYAYKNGRSARLNGGFNPRKLVTLTLVEPGTRRTGRRTWARSCSSR